jgi:hypothetical protein
MAPPQDADGKDSFQLWWTADKEWAFSLGVGCGANNLSLQKRTKAVDPRARLQLEGLHKLKTPMALPGIEPATFRLAV